MHQCMARTVWFDLLIRPVSVRSSKCTTTKIVTKTMFSGISREQGPAVQN